MLTLSLSLLFFYLLFKLETHINIPISIYFLQKLNNPIYNIPIFLYIAMYVNVVYSFFYKNNNICYTLITIFLFNVYISNNYLISNLSLNFYKNVDIIIRLTNGLLIIHPVILYIFYSFIFLFFFKMFFFKIYQNNILFYFFYSHRTDIYIFGLISLILGSW
jgi:hypothetical protein